MKVSARLVIFELLAFLVFATIAIIGFLAWRLSQGPIDLELIRPQVEQALSNARGGNPVRVETLVLEWSRTNARVEAAARGLTALDESGEVAFRADRAVVAFDAASLLAGRIKTRRMRLEGGSAALERSSDGVWTVADVVVVREPPAGDLLSTLRNLNWATLATPIRALISAGAFEQVEFADFRFEVDDQKSGTQWQAYPVEGVWKARASGVELDLDMQLIGRADPNRVRIELSSDGEVTRATGRLVLDGVDPASLAQVFGYTGDNFATAAPGNAEFSIAATEAGGLETAQLSLSDVMGKSRIEGVEVDIKALQLVASFDPASRAIELTSLDVDSDRLRGRLTGRFDISGMLAGNLHEPAPFELSGQNFTLSAQPMFGDDWTFDAVDIAGGVSFVGRRLTVDRIAVESGGLKANGAGELWLGPDETGATRIGARVEAVAEGRGTKEAVLAFWPVKLGADAREWVSDNINAGIVTRAEYVMDWPPGANAQGYLADEVLTLDFDVEEASVQILEDIPPATSVIATGHLRGNSLTVDVESGRFSQWAIDGGEVDMPRFSPSGADMRIAATGRGPLKDIMRVLDRSELNIGEVYGLNIEGMSGTGGLEVEFLRPMRSEVADESLRYTISGGFQNAFAPDLVGGFGLNRSNVRVEVKETGMSISGAGEFGPAPVVFDWSERFEPGVGDAVGQNISDLTASAKVTPDLLNAFGFAARNVMQGEAAVDLRARGSGRDFQSITANVDLTYASLELPEFGWRKDYDEAAMGSFRYVKDAAGRGVANGDIRADGLELIGDITFAPEGDLSSIGIERIFSRGSVDLRGGVTRRPDGGYVIALRGPLFDASPWMDTFLSMSGGDAPEEPAAADQPLLQISLDAQRIKLREEATLLDANVNMLLDSKGPREGRITGHISDGKAVDVRIEPEGDARRISLRSDDAGFGAKVLLKLDYLVGGTLTLNGVFTDGVGNAVLTMENVRLVQAPLLAQILSLASLRGLNDVLNGDGVLFTHVETPLRLSEGRIDIPGLRASGPAMGLTARGWIAPGDGELSLDGVLVPSFGINSALGGLPIIGDLFVSRQGEGIFAPTYSVRGDFSRARVSINPIAAVTPGVLRRIFENPEQPPPIEPEVSSDTSAEPPPAQPDRPAAPSAN